MKTQKLLLTLIAFFIISWPSYIFATSGCCSHHNGVCGCDSSVGRQLCCDGTDSPSCGCAYNPPAQKPISALKLISPSTDTTDYKALSASLQSQLDSVKNDLQKAKSSTNCPSPISASSNSDDNSGWAWLTTLLSIGLGISLIVVRHNKGEIEKELFRLKSSNSKEQ